MDCNTDCNSEKIVYDKTEKERENGMKRCLLDETKNCTECGECDRCDLDPNKLCDNCCKCLETSEQPFIQIPVADIVLEQPESYLREYFSEEEETEFEGEEARLGYELPDAALLAEWEKKLQDLEKEKQDIKPLHGVRKRKRPN